METRNQDKSGMESNGCPMGLGRQDKRRERWMTVNELMAKLQISRSTVYRWSKANIIPAHKVPHSRTIYFSEEEIDAFLHANPFSPSGRIDKIGLNLT